jgi:hypothetical protein
VQPLVAGRVGQRGRASLSTASSPVSGQLVTALIANPFRLAGWAGTAAWVVNYVGWCCMWAAWRGRWSVWCCGSGLPGGGALEV